MHKSRRVSTIMLQFFKKTGRRKSIAGGGSIDTNEVTVTAGTDPAVLAHQSGPKSDDVINVVNLPENDDEVLYLAERYCLERRDAGERVSKLSRRMSDILADQNSMCFFVQYMESRKALSLVKFWLDVESFKSAAFESKRLIPVTGTVERHFPTGLHRSVSSDGYDTMSHLSVDCDAVSMNSCSENTFEDTHSTEDVREIHSRTSQSCTPVPSTARGVLEVVDMKEDIFNAVGNAEQAIVQQKEVKQMEICDITIMRQSLTDDEKTQICEAGKGTSGESSSSAVPKTKCEEGNVFNSLINSDAVRIYKKYLTTSSPHYIEVPATILSTISLALCSGACSSVIFNEVQQLLLELLERNYLNPFLESSFYCNYTLEVLTSENLTLVDILGSEMALFYFMEYLEQHKKRHYLECYVAAVNFKQSFENRIQAQKDAIVLYEKYFSLQATCSLKLSDSVRYKLEEQICSADPANIAMCFELPLQIIERFLEQRFFAGFIKSLLYSRFINELLGKVRTNLSNNVSGIVEGSRHYASRESDNKGHRKTLSDVSSNRDVGVKRGTSKEFKTISSHNTLLAMSDTNFQRNRKSLVPILHSAGPNMPSTTGMSGSSGRIDIMQIDSRQLYNPDLLWRRNSPATGLTFGRVDALGRYERDIDIAGPPSGDDRWNRNKIKRAVRKLVNLPEDKAQEELAWQVAEMIVKDITSVTMNNKT